MRNIFQFCSKKRASRALLLLVPFLSLTDASAYCGSAGGNTNYEWLERLELGAFSNSSGANGGYADYSQQIIDLAPGVTPFLLEPGFRSSSYNEYWRAWIDFNQDQAFQSSELVFSGASSSSLSGSITVPSSVPNGETRMRVSMKYGGAPAPCEAFTYGEVEDYTVRFDTVDTSSPVVVSHAPISTATDVAVTSAISVTLSEPIDPLSVDQTSLSLRDQGTQVSGSISVNETTITFQPDQVLNESTTYMATLTGVSDLAGNPLMQDVSWSFTTQTPDFVSPLITQASPANGSDDVSTNFVVQVRFSEEMDASTINASTFAVTDGVANVPGNIIVSGNTVQFYADSSFEYSTAYSIVVDGLVKDLAGNSLGQSAIFDFTTRAFQPNYCSAVGQNVSYFWVNSVKVGNFTATFQGSPTSGYRDSTSTSFDVSRFYNSLTLKPAYSGSQFPVYWDVFIDQNQDGDLSADELVFQGNGTGTTSGSFSISDDALGGHTRMRVMMKYGSPATACGSFPYGQVVDFRVLIPESTGDVVSPNIESLTPSDNQNDVDVTSSIIVGFSEEIDMTSVNQQSISLTTVDGVVDTSFDFEVSNNTLSVTPNTPMGYGVTHTFEIANSITDVAGNALDSGAVSSFVTSQPSMDNFYLSGSISVLGSEVQGATVTVSGDASLSVMSSNSGSFSFSDLSPGTYTISVSKYGYTFAPASVVVEIIDTAISSIEFVGELIDLPLTNGDFETGDFTGFSLYETDNGHVVSSVVSSNTVTNGATSYAAQIAPGVEGTNDVGNPGGGGIFQGFVLQDGDLNVEIDVAAISSNGNGDGGIIEVFFDDVAMASHDFGNLSPDVKEFSTLSFSLPNIEQGAHELRIQSTREYLTTSVYHQIDNIVLSGSSVAE